MKEMFKLYNKKACLELLCQIDMNFSYRSKDVVPKYLYDIYDIENLVNNFQTVFNTTLTPQELVVIEKRFGLNCDKLTLNEVGPIIHLTKERVRQIQNKAIRKMKRHSVIKILQKKDYSPLIEDQDIPLLDRPITYLNILHSVIVKGLYKKEYFLVRDISKLTYDDFLEMPGISNIAITALIEKLKRLDFPDKDWINNIEYRMKHPFFGKKQ